MAYRLKQNEGMAGGIRRIVAEQLEGAIDQLEGRGDSDRDEAVHDARKRMKKSRSALRLVRDDIGRRERRPENIIMRDAARRLSGARDAQVLLEALDSLPGEGDGAGALSDAVAGFRAKLERRRNEIEAEGRLDQWARESARELEAVLGRSGDWPLDDEGFESARRGLKRIHARGRRAMRVAVERGDDESWHEWRKRAKDLWYSLRILSPIAPAQLAGAVDEADRLSDVLGNHNDVAVLRATLEEHAGELDPVHVELLRASLDRRRDELRLGALPLGKRLYDERPKDFAARIAAYWDARELERAAEAHAADSQAD
jgi:CHAD domain-containing protein